MFSFGDCCKEGLPSAAFDSSGALQNNTMHAIDYVSLVLVCTSVHVYNSTSVQSVSPHPA